MGGAGLLRRLKVVGNSMAPTLESGDLLLVNTWPTESGIFRGGYFPRKSPRLSKFLHWNRMPLGVRRFPRHLWQNLKRQTLAVLGLSTALKIGDLVLVQRINRKNGERDFIQIKRLIRIEGVDFGPEHIDSAGIWVEGDNAKESTDSRTWGHLQSDEVIGKVLFRYRKALPPSIINE